MGAVCTVSILFAISWPGAALTIREYPGPHELWSLVESVAITSLLYWWIASAKRRQAAEREAKVVTFPGPRARAFVGLGLLASASTASAQAEAPTTPASSAEEKTEDKAEEPSQRFELHGSVDTVFAYNFNRPADHANFFPGVGTSAKRHNEVTINLAQADFVLRPEPVGFKLSLGFGNAPEVVHARRYRELATSPDVWRNVLQARSNGRPRSGAGCSSRRGSTRATSGWRPSPPRTTGTTRAPGWASCRPTTRPVSRSPIR